MTEKGTGYLTWHREYMQNVYQRVPDEKDLDLMCDRSIISRCYQESNCTSVELCRYMIDEHRKYIY